MSNRVTVLISGRSKASLLGLQMQLQSQSDIEVQIRHATNGHMDPLHEVHSHPDILLLDLSAMWEDELSALSQRPGTQRPPLITIGSDGDTRMLRLAMQAGSRDFFTHPVPTDELLKSIYRIASEEADKEGPIARLTTVINAKGGSGGSLLACNLAHMLTAHLNQQTALIDMDVQFGTLPLYLDLSPKYGLLEALANVQTLDAVALEGYMAQHKSGLHLLASHYEQLSASWGLSAESLSELLSIATRSYDHLIVDLPRHIDPLTVSLIENSDRVLLVMQQSLAHLRDAKSLLKIVTSELAVPKDRIHIIVNRHDTKNAVSVDDIQNTLNTGKIDILPNDFKRVADSINSGIPLYENYRGAAITQSILELAIQSNGTAPQQKKGLFGSFTNMFKGQGDRI